MPRRRPWAVEWSQALGLWSACEWCVCVRVCVGVGVGGCVSGVCVCACVRACMCACVRACLIMYSHYSV